MQNDHYIAATFSALLSTITAHLASMTCEIGCTLRRWRQSLNVAIEKAVGIQLLEKIQTIHLLKADYNTGTKLRFAQGAMKQALDFNQNVSLPIRAQVQPSNRCSIT